MSVIPEPGASMSLVGAGIVMAVMVLVALLVVAAIVATIVRSRRARAQH